MKNEVFYDAWPQRSGIVRSRWLNKETNQFVLHDFNSWEDLEEAVGKRVQKSFPDLLPKRESTPKQKWAQKRNFGKGRICGMMTQLRVMRDEIWITLEERMELTDALQHLRWVHEKWDSQNGLSRARTVWD